MIKIKKFEHLHWRNRFAEYPVTVVSIDHENDLFSKWRFESLPIGVRNLIIKRYPLLESSFAKSTATEFLSALAISIQYEKFSIPLVAGTRGEEFYFGSPDHIYSYNVVLHIAGFLQFLIAHPNLNEENIAHALRMLEDNCEQVAIDQSVRSAIAEAQKRGIPWFRLVPEIGDVQFGQGHLQKRLRATVTSEESALGLSYSRDKVITNRLLSTIGLPVGRFATVTNPEQAAEAAKAIGFPIVIKPNSGAKGVDVIIGLNTPEQVYKHAEDIFKRWPHITVQTFFPGHDHRILVVEGKFVAAARREPAFVIADGKSTVQQLVDIANTDPRRGRNYYKVMNYIIINDELKRVIARQGLNLLSIPQVGVKIELRLTANISSGGTAVDVTDIIHPDNIYLAERAAMALGLKVSGVDFITTDISRSWKEIGGGICEVNASVGLRPHWIGNINRDIMSPIFNIMYRPVENGRIPTAMITGSNGKTTTTRMLDHILRAAGHNVGCVTTDGITINGKDIIEGDVAGSSGASVVLRDPTVTAAALETARGGLLRSGMYLDYCDVAALLNVDNDQVGIDGIDTVQQMADLKRKVVDSAKHKVILNGEDKYCLAIAKDFPLEKVILFSVDNSIEPIKAHINAGGIAITLGRAQKGKEKIIIHANGKTTNIIAVEDVPAALGGIARHNIANALAAAALAYGMNIDVKKIATGLAAFTPTLNDSSGRFNIIYDLPVPVLFDFANNVPAFRTIIESVIKIPKVGNSICVFTAPGNRPDDQIDGIAKEVSGHFDYYICYEHPHWRRGRETGYISGQLANILIQNGIEKDKIITCLTQDEAMVIAANLAKKDDFITAFGTYINKSLPEIRKAFEMAGELVVA